MKFYYQLFMGVRRIDALPDEMLLIIFHRLPAKDLLLVGEIFVFSLSDFFYLKFLPKVHSVSKRWRQVAGDQVWWSFVLTYAMKII